MKCYRNGGCGPYEDRSCSECPASKPEYLERYTTESGMFKNFEEVLATIEKEMNEYSEAKNEQT